MYALPELGRLDDVASVVNRRLFLPSILFTFSFSAFYFSKITILRFYLENKIIF
jgi:hypothetical protein